jgi:serine phosphatase RsbU (regulator of sigma subunit)
MVADGLGHGYDANVASGKAVKVLHRYPDLSPKELLERCHLALRSTRGAAVAVARVDPARSLVTFAGVGNIGAQIYSSSRASTQRLVSMNGTSGAHSSRIQEFSYVWPDDALLVVYTDGLTTSASVEAYPRLPTRDPSLIAGVLYRDFGRGHDDATVVVAKAA